MINTRTATAAEVEFVLPAYNEGKAIEMAVLLLTRWLRANATYSWCVTVADNASTDSTLETACELAATDPEHIRVIHLDGKGRGYALKSVWESSSASVVAYMDADLSTDLADINRLVDPLLEGTADIVVGSRLMRGSRVTRCLKREVISRCYNLMLRRSFGYDLTDAQCGFKAMSSRVASVLLPEVKDGSWFFDTELVDLAYASGLEIVQIPVTWRENLDTSVEIAKTITENLAGMKRMREEFACGRIPFDRIHDAGCKAASARPERGVALTMPLSFATPTDVGPSRAGRPGRRATVAAMKAKRTTAYISAPARAEAGLGGQ